jgi:hypothetical protein
MTGTVLLLFQISISVGGSKLVSARGSQSLTSLTPFSTSAEQHRSSSPQSCSSEPPGSSGQRRIIVIPVRNSRNGSVTPLTRLSPTKASCLSRSQAVTSLTSAMSYGSPVNDSGTIRNASPSKDVRQPLVALSGSSVNNSSASDYSGGKLLDDTNDRTSCRYSAANSRPPLTLVTKSSSFDSVEELVSDEESTDASSASGVNAAILNNSQTICEAGASCTRSLTCLTSHALTHTKDSMQSDCSVFSQEAHAATDKSCDRTDSRTVCIPTTAIVRPLTASMPLVSVGCSAGSSPSQTKRIVLCDSASTSAASGTSGRGLNAKLPSVAVNYSCVVTSSGGVSKIIFLPATSANSSKPGLSPCSPVRSDNIFQSMVSSLGTTTSPAPASIVSSGVQPTSVCGLPTLRIKAVERSNKDVGSPLYKGSGHRKTDGCVTLAHGCSSVTSSPVSADNSKLHSMSASKLLGLGSDDSRKTAIPFVPFSQNLATGARILLLRKVDAVGCDNESNARVSAAQVQASVSSPAKTLATSDNESSSDAESVLVLDADTLLPADRSPVVKRSPAKEKVIILNHNRSPARTIRTRRSPGDSEELGRGKRKRKSQLAARFLDFSGDDRIEIIDRIMKPVDQVKPVRKKLKNPAALPRRGKKSENKAVISPRAQLKHSDTEASSLKKSMASHKEPRQPNGSAEKSSRSPQQKVRRSGSSDKLPAKSRRVSKQVTNADKLKVSRPSSRGRSGIRTKSKMPVVKSCVNPNPVAPAAMPNGVSRDLPTYSCASLSELSVSCGPAISNLPVISNLPEQNRVREDVSVRASPEAVTQLLEPLSPKMPHLSKSNKSMKLDVTNEDGVVESLVVEIVDITSSEEDDEDDDTVQPPPSFSITSSSASNAPTWCLTDYAPRLPPSLVTSEPISVRPAAASPEIPVIKVPTVVPQLQKASVENLSDRASKAASRRKRPDKPRGGGITHAGIEADLQTPKPIGVPKTKRRSAPGTLPKRTGSRPTKRLSQPEGPLSARDLPASNSTNVLQAARPASNIASVDSVCGIENQLALNRHFSAQADELSASGLRMLSRKLGGNDQGLLPPARAHSSTSATANQMMKIKLHLSDEQPKILGSRNAKETADEDEDDENIPLVEVAKQQSNDGCSAEGGRSKKVKNLLKRSEKSRIMKGNGNSSRQQLKRGKGLIRKRKHDKTSFGDDDDYSNQVKRLNKMYGGGHKRSKHAASSAKQSRSDADNVAKVYTGPVVRIRGSTQHAASCVVVAGECDVDDEVAAKPKKKPFNTEHSRLPTSFQMDDSVPWLCVFCHRCSNYRSLGDLFGPYYRKTAETTAVGVAGGSVSVSPKDRRRMSPGISAEASQAQKVLLQQQQQRKSRVQKYIPAAASAVADASSKAVNIVSSIDSVPAELWVHEECAVWTSGVYLLGNQLNGLEEAAVIATQAVNDLTVTVSEAVCCSDVWSLMFVNPTCPGLNCLEMGCVKKPML